jgi:CBS domain-containing protein
VAVTATRPVPQVLHLSLIVGGALRDSAGERLGRVDDLIVRLGEDEYPPITGVLATVASRQAYVPAERVADIAHGEVRLSREQLDLRRFERRPEEVLLRKDVLDRQLINVDGARLVRANEIELARLGGWWRVVGVDTGVRGALRRLVPRRFGQKIATLEFLDWASVEPFVGHVPTVRLRVPHPKLARLHPAQIADLVESASHSEGEEIIEAVGRDEELEADVFEELDEQHQREFIEERSDAEVADVVRRMAADDAADLIAELPEERREAVLTLLPSPQRAKVRALLGYDPAEAGGLMSLDFIYLDRHGTVEEARERVRTSAIPPHLLTNVYVMDSRRVLEGAVPVAELIRSESGASLSELSKRESPRLKPDAELEEVARLMSDYNLTAAPVVDDEGRMIGVITVDDVLEVMLPKGWRRRFGLLGDD